MSAAGGLWTAFDRAEEAGCDVIQIFTKNKGAWKAAALGAEEIRAFRDRARKAGGMPVVAHAAYLLNLASPAPPLRKRSVEALRVEMERCEALGIPHLVLHPGSHMGAGEEAGLKLVVKSLDSVHRSTRGFKTKVLLETSPGQGSSVCHRFESLGKVLGEVKEPERLGICVDTCHIFVAGYELRTDDGYEATLEELEREVGLEEVLCVHTNDSKKELGSRVDRHEHIGRGCLGLDGFRRLVNDRRFEKSPMILELPPENNMNRVNLSVLRKLQKRGHTRREPRASSRKARTGNTPGQAAGPHRPS